ncbi:sulfite exporter TauE/SafE family protein [Leucothrix sargassi]|nr:sulfite exporter TauE/SafE family protein [Leucothrix sargassi]
MSSFSTTVLISTVFIVLLSGIIKGAIGFAMPLVIVSGVGSLMDPKYAIAAILLPIVMSNAMQTFRQGVTPALQVVRDYWRYILMVCVAIFGAAQLVPNIKPSVFYWVLGIPVVVLSLIQLLGWTLTITPRHRGWAEWLIGGISGVLGGLAGTWGPTTVLYLLAVETPKAKQMVVQGVVYGLGAVTLLLAHIQSGVLNAQTLPFSAMLLPPAFFGMWLGFKIQDRLNQALFRKITLIVLVIAGLNLLRKGIIG